VSASATLENIGAKPFTDDKKKGVVRLALLVAVVGLALGGAAYGADHERFAWSYLVGFLWATTIALGALFFVLIQHLTRASWSVAARRPMEWLSSALPATALLFLPLIAFSHDIYHHWMSEEAHHDELLKGKLGYLNPKFFFIRAGIYFAIWTLVSLFFARTSRAQDTSGDVSLSRRMQKMSAPSILLFGLSLSFAAFDWIMSIDPHWYSTIFGLYLFAGSAVSSLSALALITIRLRQAGVLGKASTLEHQHDIGKLMFGFTVFWAYIGFSQFILIWYANLPEETVYYRERWLHGWNAVSLTLFFGHFVLPFLGLMSRHAKRNPTVLSLFAVLILAMHYVDLYWMVMPYHAEHPDFSWIDLGGLLAPAGVVAVAVAMAMSKSAAYPLKDPRLAESLQAENL